MVIFFFLLSETHFPRNFLQIRVFNSTIIQFVLGQIQHLNEGSQEPFFEDMGDISTAENKLCVLMGSSRYFQEKNMSIKLNL